MLLALFFAVALASDPATVFISPFGADDSARAGTLAYPFLTLSYAYSRVSTGGTINVLRGLYSAPQNFITFAKDVTVAGYPSNATVEDFVLLARLGQGGMYITSGVVTFRGLTFRGTWAWVNSNSLITVSPGCMVRVSSCTFSGGWNPVITYGNFTMEDSLVRLPAVSAAPYVTGIMAATPTRGGTLVSLRNSLILGPPSTYRGVSMGIAANAPNMQIEIDSMNFTSLSRGVAVNVPIFLNVNYARFDSCHTGIMFFNIQGRSNVIAAIYATVFTNCGSANVSYPRGGGMLVNGGVSMTITDTVFWNNSLTRNGALAGQGAGIWCNGTSTINLSNCDFNGNRAADGASGWCGPSCGFYAVSTGNNNNQQNSDSGPCEGLF